MTLALLADAASLIAGLDLDSGTLLRLAIALVLVLTVLRLMGRAAWLTARLVAGLLIALVLLALLFGKPSRLGDLPALRQSALDAARALFD